MLALSTAAALAAGAAPVASAAASASHATNWATHGQKVDCGIAMAVPGTEFDSGTMSPQNGLWPGLQCSAAGIPRPPQGVGDPFVQLGQGKTGRARIVDESQDDLVSGAPFEELAAGTAWKRDGIACAVRAASVRCVNSAGHGFRLSPGHVKLF